MVRFHNAFVRGTGVTQVPEAEVNGLAAFLLEQPVEILLTAHGAQRGGEPLRYPGVATALARRNIRSLLALNSSLDCAAGALKMALTGLPRDAESALDDAGLAFNLRYSIFAAADATLSIQDGHLIVTDADTPGLPILIPRVELRERGRAYFSTDALARLSSLPIEGICFSDGCIIPLALQREAGAVMEPDTAQYRLHKGDWRSTRKLDFAKEFCITCSKCFIHCPENAILHAMFDKTAKDGTGILGIDYDRCTACGICVSVCPADRSGYRALVMIGTTAEATREVHHVS